MPHITSVNLSVYLGAVLQLEGLDGGLYLVDRSASIPLFPEDRSSEPLDILYLLTTEWLAIAEHDASIHPNTNANKRLISDWTSSGFRNIWHAGKSLGEATGVRYLIPRPNQYVVNSTVLILNFVIMGGNQHE